MMKNWPLGLLMILLTASCQHTAKPVEPTVVDTKEKVSPKPNYNYNFKALNTPVDSLQSGDLVLRHGNGFSSDLFLAANDRDEEFSHSAIVSVDSNGERFVYHIIGGAENPMFNLKKDSIEVFCHPQYALKFGFVKYDLKPEERHRVDSLCAWYLPQNVQFDWDFDLKTDKEMYCSEFIYKVLCKSTKDSTFVPLTKKKDKYVVGVDDLFLNNHCKKFYEHEYPKKSH